MNESSDPETRRPDASDTAALVLPSVARVKRRLVGLVVTLTVSLTLPHLLGSARASPGEPHFWWPVVVGAALLVLGAALLAIRYALQPDLDALERTRRELDARQRSTLAASRDTNEYLQDVSHEIRASMHAVLGLTQLLSRSPLDATQHRQTRTIDGAARALLRIINDLLAFSGPGPHRFELVPMGCSLHDMLRVSTDLLEPSAKDKGLALELRVAVDLPDRVLIDAGRVQQVVLGVCRHAIEASEQGALQIEARARKLRVKRFELSLRVQVLRAAPPRAGPDASEVERSEHTPSDLEGSAVEAAAAEGRASAGVSVALQPEPASQAGLSLSRRLVALMGGSIRLGEPRGTIELTLPIARVDGIPEVSQRGQHSAALSSPLPLAIRLPASASPILLVEADERAQVAALELLENLGFEVEVAASAARALERAGQNRYALILIATALPDADGYAAAASLRALLGTLPAIIGCTEEAPVAALARPADASLDALLTKPLERAALCAALAEWLPDETHPASSGTRLSQSGALAQATRRALGARWSPPPSTLPDLAPGQRSQRLLELLVLEAPAVVRALTDDATRGRRDAVAALAERLGERCARAGAPRMAALCQTLSGARDLSLEQLGASARALGKALDGLLSALGEPAPPADSAPASATTDRNPDSP
jgi:CheY-like chemotaxis protein